MSAGIVSGDDGIAGCGAIQIGPDILEGAVDTHLNQSGKGLEGVLP